MHSLCVGMTESGKTALAKLIAYGVRDEGFAVLVLDPLLDPEWPADFITDDADRFLGVAKASQNCFLFIDESAESVGHWDKQNFWLATQSRHWGHSAVFCSQRAQMISPTIRGQCGNLYIFNVSRTDAEILANEFNQPELREANQLKKLEYFYTGRFKNPVKCIVPIEKLAALTGRDRNLTDAENISS